MSMATNRKSVTTNMLWRLAVKSKYCEDVDFLCNQERKNLTALMNDVLIYNKDNRFSIIRT